MYHLFIPFAEKHFLLAEILQDADLQQSSKNNEQSHILYIKQIWSFQLPVQYWQIYNRLSKI